MILSAYFGRWVRLKTDRLNTSQIISLSPHPYGRYVGGPYGRRSAPGIQRQQMWGGTAPSAAALHTGPPHPLGNTGTIQPAPPYGPVGKRIPLPHLPAGIPLGAHAWRSEERLTPTPRGGTFSLPTHGPVGKRAPLPRWLVGKTRGISRGARAALPGRAPYTSGLSGRDTAR